MNNIISLSAVWCHVNFMTEILGFCTKKYAIAYVTRSTVSNQQLTVLGNVVKFKMFEKR